MSRCECWWVSASLRTDSLNTRLANLATAVIERLGSSVDLAAMRDFDAPSHDGDLESAAGLPAGAHLDHPLIRSYEPGENWWWCYPDELAFEIDDAPPSPSHP